MLTLLLTCPYGLAGVLNQELKYLKYKPFNSFDTGTFVQTDRHGLIHLNLRSRIASKIYVQIQPSVSCMTFEELYTITHAAPWTERLPGTEFLSVSVHTHQSQLHAPRSIQSIVHKAVLTHLQEGRRGHVTAPANFIEDPYEIFCHLERDQLSLWLNTSGAGLHQRGYRLEAGEAPLKETVAAALVLMSGRRRQDLLWDPLCGSGTICIEAAMIARNIAPGLQRSFAFQQFINYPPEQFEKTKNEARASSFTKTYQIIGSDNDTDLLEKAGRNAERAGVADTINFLEHDLLTSSKSPPTPLSQGGSQGAPPFNISPFSHLHIITNPPYGKRLQPSDLKELYKKLVQLSDEPTTHLTMISSYPEFSNLLTSRRPRREVTNGPDLCYVRQKPVG